MRNKRSSTAVQRWGAKALTLLLACALMAGLAVTASARGDWQGEVVDPAIPMPIVTIQGNLVVDNGKPTGFYELALCVQSGRTITDLTGVVGAAGSVISEEAYANYIGAHPSAEGNSALFDIHYYPFRTATAAMNVNTDILTAVHWNLESVTYENYDKINNSYPLDATNPGKYPRGIITDPAVQGYEGTGLTEADAFPDITTPNLDRMDNDSVFVALDVEGDPRMSTVQGAAEHFENNAALITLSASAPDNYPVVLKESTPLVVARFSYDLKRFSTTKVSDALSPGTMIAQRNSITGDAVAGADGFWMGWDKTSGLGASNFSGKQALTWLGQSTGTFDFSRSDELAAQTQGDQTVWVHTGTKNGSLTDRETYYYYYLGAEDYQNDGPDTISVKLGKETVDVAGVTIPRTEGQKVLTEGTDLNTGAPPAEYTYFKNLLRLRDDTLVVKLVNEPTFKKPSGTGGVQVLFYDWDDTLIGATIVDKKGDVRAQVNAYVEKNMVHPDLRTTDILENDLGGELPDLTAVSAATSNTDSAERRYKAIIDSNDRQWTYRGNYSAKLDGTGVVRDENDPEPGKEYPLTNKLDYVFYRHINTETVLEYENGGAVTTERYISAEKVSSNNEAAVYPWAYGWAVVEDNSARNKAQWQVRRDAEQLENVWTAFGVGELSNLNPSYDTLANPGVQSVPTTLPGTPVPGTAVGGGTGMETKYPAFFDLDTVTAPTDYAYRLSSAGDNGYLRFADFSKIEDEMTRNGQNVLVVKAVYEPGPELLEGGQYMMTSAPYYNKLNAPAAAAGGAYSAEITLERASLQHPDGMLRGVSRVRLPSVRQDTTVDQKWITDNVMGVEHDLANPSIEVAKARTETTFTKVDVDNGEAITFTLSLSARQNKVDYFITETYRNNFVSGGTRSDSNYNRYSVDHAIDNYYYMTDDADENDTFFDKQNIYYQAPRYSVREGTHGFVLYGTLNYLMQQATLVNRGDLSTTEFNTNATLAQFNDINLQIIKNGAPTAPTSGTDQTTIRTALKNAAAWCEAHKSADTWNYELDCAELSYHQLQHYLTSGTMYASRAAADAATIDWCHLHRDCFKDPEAAAAPKSWDEIMAFAADPSKAKGISLLTGGTTGKIEELTFLRITANGDPFPSGSAFQAKIVDAVAKLTAAGQPLTWANIQYFILEGIPPTGDQAMEKALASYWWYNGATSKPSSPRSLADLETGARAYTAGATLKDGNLVTGWRFGLTGLETVFNQNAAAAGSETAANWVRLTENLVASRTVNDDGGETTSKFADYATFEAALLDAMNAADQAGVTAAGDSRFWYKLQYHILHSGESGYAFPATPTADQDAEMDGYWWHNGGKLYLIRDLSSMLDIVSLIDEDEAAAAAWSRFDFTTVAAKSELQFSKDFNGNMYTAADMADFKAAIEAMSKLPGAPTLSAGNAENVTLKNAVWAQVQYYLIHGSVSTSEATLETNKGYYWWKDGGSPTAPNIVTWDNTINAAFLDVYNGNAHAWDNLNKIAAMMRNSKFRNYDADHHTDPPLYAYEKLELFTTEDLQNAAISYVTTWVSDQLDADPNAHVHTVPTPSWFAMQHYLVNKTWVTTGITEADFQRRYWWYDGATEDPLKPAMAPDKPLTDFIAAHLTGGVDLTSIDDIIASDINFKIVVGGTEVKAANLTVIKTRLTTLLGNLPAGTTAADLTWYQIQTALFPSTTLTGLSAPKMGNGVYLDAATALAAYNQKVAAAKDWRPQWVKDFYDETTGLAKLSAVGDIVVNELGMTPEMERELAAADLRTQIEELEKQLAAMREQLAQLEEGEQTAAPTRPAAGTSATVPAQPEPEPPVTPAEPETPVVNDHDVRVEIPLGEDAMSATRRPIATDGPQREEKQAGEASGIFLETEGSGSGHGLSGSVSAEGTQTDMPVPLTSKVYRIEALWKRRWMRYAV